MGSNSNIEWTGDTWNPLISYNIETGKRGWFCVHVSEGCRHCYAETMNKNLYFGNGLAYTAQNVGKQRTEFSFKGQSALYWPIRAREPRRIFPFSMTDLFGSWVTDQQLIDIFGVMALAHWQTFQVLTKRIDRARDFLQTDHGIIDQFRAIQEGGGIAPREIFKALDIKRRDGVQWQWPLPNVWIGTSVEDQPSAEKRIPDLLETPAAVRWISAEPLLGEIDIRDWIPSSDGFVSSPQGPWHVDDGAPFINWVVAGYESGKDARPRNPSYVRRLRDQSVEAGVPFLFKQWGEFQPFGRCEDCSCVDGEHCEFERRSVVYGDELLVRVGKKAAGRMLDGKIWNEYPELRKSDATTRA